MAIDIDQAWYDAHLEPEGAYFPVLLTGNGETYRLVGDIQAQGSGLLVGGKDQTLDLNGHTLTWDVQPEIVVPNGDFEAGEIGQPPPDWDISRAPGFLTEANGTNGWPYLWGTKVGMFTGPNKHIIKSTNVTIPSIYLNKPVAAMVTGHGSWNTPSAMRVLDGGTGAIVGQSNLTASNQTVLVGFVVTSQLIANGVHLEIEFTHPTAGAKIPIDRVCIRPHQNCGVFYGHASWYLPTYLKTTKFLSALQGVTGWTVLGPGSLAQGKAKSVRARAIECLASGIKLADGITCSALGDDPGCIGGPYSGGGSVIRNCIFDFPGGKNPGRPDYCITNRSELLGAIIINSVTTVTIEKNQILNYPQCGITLFAQLTSTGRVAENVMKPNAYFTNCWGIMLYGAASNVLIERNQVISEPSKSGRGMMIDGSDVKNVSYRSNVCKVRERGNREYGTAGLECQALKIRAYQAGKIFATFEDNVWESTTDDTLVHGAAGGTMTISATDGNIGITFTRDVFRATVTGTNKTYEAPAFVLNGNPLGPAAGDAVQFVDCTFLSNQVSIQAHNNDLSGSVRSGKFIAPLIVKDPTPPPAGVTYRPYVFGFDWGGYLIQNVRIFGPKYSGGAEESVIFIGVGIPKDVTIGRLVPVNVTDGAGKPVDGALVTWTDAATSQIEYDEDETGTDGLTRPMNVPELVFQQLTANSTVVNIVDRKPQRLEILHPDYERVDETIAISKDQLITRKLTGGPTPLPSPSASPSATPSPTPSASPSPTPSASPPPAPTPAKYAVTFDGMIGTIPISGKVIAKVEKL